MSEPLTEDTRRADRLLVCLPLLALLGLLTVLGLVTTGLHGGAVLLITTLATVAVAHAVIFWPAPRAHTRRPDVTPLLHQT